MNINCNRDLLFLTYCKYDGTEFLPADRSIIIPNVQGFGHLNSKSRPEVVAGLHQTDNYTLTWKYKEPRKIWFAISKYLKPLIEDLEIWDSIKKMPYLELHDIYVLCLKPIISLKIA